jgi:hypothetical protein
VRASYRCGSGKKRAGIKEELRGRNFREVTVSGVEFGQRRKKVTWPWLVGPTRQRGKEETEYRFGFLRWAADLFRYWAENRPRGPFSIFISSFSLFFFGFLVSFISFANLI